jgi:hypothetical protein
VEPIQTNLPNQVQQNRRKPSFDVLHWFFVAPRQNTANLPCQVVWAFSREGRRAEESKKLKKKKKEKKKKKKTNFFPRSFIFVKKKKEKSNIKHNLAAEIPFFLVFILLWQETLLEQL